MSLTLHIEQSDINPNSIRIWVETLTNFELGEDGEAKRPDVEEAEVDSGEATEPHEQQPYAQRLHRQPPALNPQPEWRNSSSGSARCREICLSARCA
jgi:hypothetical protein